jgi:hypothetical protein
MKAGRSRGRPSRMFHRDFDPAGVNPSLPGDDYSFSRVVPEISAKSAAIPAGTNIFSGPLAYIGTDPGDAT